MLNMTAGNLGRPARPLEQALARGTEGAKERARTAPARVKGDPTPPAWLDEHGLAMWMRACHVLEQRGQLSLESATPLEALCRCYSDWMRLSETLRDEGFSYRATSVAGELIIRARPEAAMFADTDRRLRNWLCEFGLTDATRGKVEGSGAPVDDDPLSKYVQ